MLCAKLGKLAQWFWKRRFLNFCQFIFPISLLYPRGKGCGSIFVSSYHDQTCWFFYNQSRGSKPLKSVKYQRKEKIDKYLNRKLIIIFLLKKRKTLLLQIYQFFLNTLYTYRKHTVYISQTCFNKSLSHILARLGHINLNFRFSS